MLTMFAASFVLFLLVVGGMSLGYVFKRKTLQGSCGGITALGMEKVCDCPEPCDARKSASPRKRCAAKCWKNTGSSATQVFHVGALHSPSPQPSPNVHTEYLMNTCLGRGG